MWKDTKNVPMTTSSKTAYTWMLDFHLHRVQYPTDIKAYQKSFWERLVDERKESPAKVLHFLGGMVYWAISLAPYIGEKALQTRGKHPKILKEVLNVNKRQQPASATPSHSTAIAARPASITQATTTPTPTDTPAPSVHSSIVRHAFVDPCTTLALVPVPIPPPLDVANTPNHPQQPTAQAASQPVNAPSSSTTPSTLHGVQPTEETANDEDMMDDGEYIHIFNLLCIICMQTLYTNHVPRVQTQLIQTMEMRIFQRRTQLVLSWPLFQRVGHSNAHHHIDVLFNSLNICSSNRIGFSKSQEVTANCGCPQHRVQEGN